MQKRSKVMLLGVITALILALPLAAQNYDANVLGSAPVFSSNTKTGTATIFANDVDNYINYHKYSTVNFDKGFGFITGAPYRVSSDYTKDPDDPTNAKYYNPMTGKLSAGYAHNFGSLYLGVLYQGNIFQNTSDKDGDKTITLTPTYDNDTRVLTQTEQTTQYRAGWLNSTNQIEFLLGIAGQGIKIGFVESLYSNEHKGSTARTETVTDTKAGLVTYQNMADEFIERGGTLKPYLGWGTNIPLGGGNLMPYLDVSMDIFSDTKVDKYSDYVTFNGKKQETKAFIGDGQDKGYLRPVGTVGVKYDLAKKETKQTTLELRYKIDMKLYNNDYEATGLSGDKVKGEVSWDAGKVNQTTKYIDHTETETNLKLAVEEKTDVTHAITPIYKLTGEPAAGFRLGFSAAVPVTFGLLSNDSYTDDYYAIEYKEKVGDYSYKYTKQVHSPDANTETTNLKAQLDFNFGASYKLIPDRFTINAGIRATPTAFTHKEVKTLAKSVDSVTTEKSVDNGNVVQDEVTVAKGTGGPDILVITNTWDGFNGMLVGGFMFNFTPAAALDMGLAINANKIGENNFTADLAEVSVIFSIKF
jgi:hypothetical protein